MEAHSVPRQITTFEFKLIGFLTLKQFIYMLFTTGIAIIFYYGVQIPILNIFLAGLVVAGGIALAFLPINERPMDVWIRNFFKKLMSASQYYYIKKNSAPDFLMDVFVTKDTNIIENHIDAQNKLNQYLQNTQTKPEEKIDESKKIIFPEENSTKTQVEDVPIITPAVNPVVAEPSPTPQSKISQNTPQSPFLWGTIKNNQGFPLPNILIYIKNDENKNIRILKSNIKGVYATFSPVVNGEYFFEIRDPANKYFFDTIKLPIQNTNQQVFNFKSKELL